MTKNMTQYADYRLRRKCCSCGKPSQKGQVRCAACATKNQRRCVAAYAARVQRRQCVKCPNPAEGDRVQCAACLAADRARGRQQREGTR
jgi:hypothetical protein